MRDTSAGSFDVGTQDWDSAWDEQLLFSEGSEEFRVAIEAAVDALAHEGNLRDAIAAIDVAISLADAIPPIDGWRLLTTVDRALTNFINSGRHLEMGDEAAVQAAMGEYWSAKDGIAGTLAALYEKSAVLRSGDREGFVMVMLHAGDMASINQDHERAIISYERLLSDYEDYLDAESREQTLIRLSNLTSQLGMVEAAEAYADRLQSERPQTVETMRDVMNRLSHAVGPTWAEPSPRALELLLDLWHEPFVQHSDLAVIRVGGHLVNQLRHADPTSALAIEINLSMLERLDNIPVDTFSEDPDEISTIHLLNMSGYRDSIRRTALVDNYSISMNRGDYGFAYEMARRYAEIFDTPDNQVGANDMRRALEALERAAGASGG